MEAAELPQKIQKVLKKLTELEDQVQQHLQSLDIEESYFQQLVSEKKVFESRSEAYGIISKEFKGDEIIENARAEEAVIDEFVESKKWTSE